MAFNLNNFISEIRHNGVHSTNRFTVDIVLPPKLTSGKSTRDGLRGTIENTLSNLSTVTATRQLSLRASRTVMPGKNIMTKQDILRFGYGQTDKVGHNIIYNDVPISFIVDNQQEITSLFDDWFDLICESDTFPGNPDACLVGYKIDYATNITITQYNSKRQRTRECTLYGAFPTVRGDIELGWDDNDRIQLLPINFTYTYHEIKK